MDQNQKKVDELNLPVVYCYYDTVAENSTPLFFAKNEALARRSYLKDMEGAPFAKDMRLYLIGRFNVRTMQMSLLPAPKELVFTDMTSIQGV